MIQTFLTYLIVALATGWTLWSMVLRGWWRQSRARRAPKNAVSRGCGDDCGCSD